MSDSPPTLDLLIVGAGFGGLYMLHTARQRGLNALVLEAADGVGGTWYHNRYPGARVDIQSLEYSFGFDDALQQSWSWSERYAAQPELLAYANHVADRYRLRDGILLRIGISNGLVCEKPGKPDSALGGQPMPAWMAWNWRLSRCLVWIRPAPTVRLALVGP